MINIKDNYLKNQYSKLKSFFYSYVLFLIKYFSFKKLFNLLVNTYEFKTKKIYLSSFPVVVHIDLCNSCVLHCPLCATGIGDKSQTKSIMKFEDFKEVFNKVKDYLFFVWLYNWGEPFLCKDIFKIIDYCHQNNVGVKIDSNLNYYNEEILQNIVKYKIDYISFSIDGLSQKAYQFYRRSGNIKKVLEGLKKINEYKKIYKTMFPITIWQFLINNNNINEVEKAMAISDELKIDVFESRPLRLFLEVDSKYSKENYNKYLSRTGTSINNAKAVQSPSPCRYLWDSLLINPDGSFSPCPVIYKDSDTFGKIKKESTVNNIVNNEKYVESRKLYVLKNYKAKIFTPCVRCNWFTKAQ